MKKLKKAILFTRFNAVLFMRILDGVGLFLGLAKGGKSGYHLDVQNNGSFPTFLRSLYI